MEFVWTTHIPPTSILWHRLRLHLDEHFDDDEAIALHLIRLVASVFEKTLLHPTSSLKETESILKAIQSTALYLENPNDIIFGNRTVLEELTAMLVDVIGTNPLLSNTQASIAFQSVWRCFVSMTSVPKMSTKTIKHAMLHLALFFGTPVFSSKYFNPHTRTLVHALYNNIELIQYQQPMF